MFLFLNIFCITNFIKVSQDIFWKIGKVSLQIPGICAIKCCIFYLSDIGSSWSWYINRIRGICRINQRSWCAIGSRSARAQVVGSVAHVPPRKILYIGMYIGTPHYYSLDAFSFFLALLSFIAVACGSRRFVRDASPILFILFLSPIDARLWCSAWIAQLLSQKNVTTFNQMLIS